MEDATMTKKSMFPVGGREGARSMGKPNLKFLTKIFNDDVSHQAGNNGNHQIRDGENIFYGENPRFSLAICTAELTHQKIGIKQENYETDFNDRSPNRG
jgi:hypothetical protein